jgi:hypothetical protein
MLPLVNECVNLFNLAALEVSDVYHIHNDGPRIDLLENVSDNVSPIKLSNIIG